MSARPLTTAEHEAFRLARLVAAEWCPYFMRGLFAVHPLADPGLGTFAVTADWRLLMDPARLVGPDAWTVQETAAVLLHEVGHLIRGHHPRSREVTPGPLQPLPWNLATDSEINDDLVAAGVPLPDPVTPTGLGLAEGGVAEVYYRALIGQGCPPRDDDPGCGSGAGGPQRPGETALPVEGAVSEAEADLIRRGVAQDVAAAVEGKGRGSVPAGVARWAAATLAPPKVAWTRLLRASLRRAVATARGRFDYTYSRPSRRPVPKVIRPAMRAPQVKVTAVVDTSGSMSDRDLAAAVSEISGVLTATGVDRHHVRVLACDAAATTPTRVRSLADVELTGGGGTDMRVGITAALAARPAPDFVIVLTDGDTPWPDAPTRVPLICVVIGNDPAATRTPAWATTVTVPTAA